MSKTDATMREIDEEISDSDSDDSDLAVFYDAVAAPKRDVHTAEEVWQPSKRIRTKGPANGTKRNAHRRVESGSLLNGFGEDIDIENSASASDTSFIAAAKAQRPKKKLRTASLRVDDAQQPQAGPSRLPKDSKKRVRRKTTSQPRSSTSFNFTPTNLLESLVDKDALDEADKYRSEGNAFYREGNFKQALASYTCALEAYPKTTSVPPPISLLTNRAAAYISLGDHPAALRDMQQSLSYPSADTEGTVKRLSRLARCYIALNKYEGTDIQEALKHLQNQLILLERIDGTDKTRKDGRKAYDDLSKGVQYLEKVAIAREKYDWEAVLQNLENLRSLPPNGTKRADPPDEWDMMQAEALGMLGRVQEAKLLVGAYLKKADTSDPAALWFKAIFAYAQAELSQAAAALDAMRSTTELPTQASRLLHRSYQISRLLESASVAAINARWAKVIAYLSEVLRIASEDQPINRQIRCTARLQRAEAYLQSGNIADSLKDCDAIMKTGDESALPDIYEFKAYAAKAKVYRLKQDNGLLVDVLRSALEVTDGVDSAAVEQVKAELQSLIAPKIDQRRWRPNATYHEILNIKTSATSAEIRAAYKKESLLNHPDKPNGDADRFKRINEAYTALSARAKQARTSSSHSYYR